MKNVTGLIEFKAFIEREYVKALIDDIEGMSLSQDEKDNLLKNKLDEAGIDLRRVIMWKEVTV